MSNSSSSSVPIPSIHLSLFNSSNYVPFSEFIFRRCLEPDAVVITAILISTPTSFACRCYRVFRVWFQDSWKTLENVDILIIIVVIIIIMAVIAGLINRCPVKGFRDNPLRIIFLTALPPFLLLLFLLVIWTTESKTIGQRATQSNSSGHDFREEGGEGKVRLEGVGREAATISREKKKKEEGEAEHLVATCQLN